MNEFDDWSPYDDYDEPLDTGFYRDSFERDPFDEKGFPNYDFPDDFDEVDDFELEEHALHELSVAFEKKFPMLNMGSRRAQKIEHGGLSRTRDKSFQNLDNSWKRHRKTRWHRHQSGFILSADLHM